MHPPHSLQPRAMDRKPHPGMKAKNLRHGLSRSLSQKTQGLRRYRPPSTGVSYFLKALARARHTSPSLLRFPHPSLHPSPPRPPHRQYHISILLFLPPPSPISLLNKALIYIHGPAAATQSCIHLDNKPRCPSTPSPPPLPALAPPPSPSLCLLLIVLLT